MDKGEGGLAMDRKAAADEYDEYYVGDDGSYG